MFTGIIKNTGNIKKIYIKNNNCAIEIFSKIKLFDSINSKIAKGSTAGSIKDASLVSLHHIKYDKFLSNPPKNDLICMIFIKFIEKS